MRANGSGAARRAPTRRNARPVTGTAPRPVNASTGAIGATGRRARRSGPSGRRRTRGRRPRRRRRRRSSTAPRRGRAPTRCALVSPRNTRRLVSGARRIRSLRRIVSHGARSAYRTMTRILSMCFIHAAAGRFAFIATEKFEMGHVLSVGPRADTDNQIKSCWRGCITTRTMIRQRRSIRSANITNLVRMAS
jgi:hypothetical protein